MPTGTWCRFAVSALLTVLVSSWPCSPLAAAGGGSAKVELRIKVVSAAPHSRFGLWGLELLDPAWNLLAQTMVLRGGTARFKNLKPGIHIICISGPHRAQRCQSADLTLPPGQSAARFEVEVRAPTPDMTPSDLLTVSVASLAVPDKARNELRRAIAARRRGDAVKALAHLKRALEICPDYAQALNDLGADSHRKGNYAQAIRHFTRAVELEPAYYASWVNLAKSYMALRDYAAPSAQR